MLARRRRPRGMQRAAPGAPGAAHGTRACTPLASAGRPWTAVSSGVGARVPEHSPVSTYVAGGAVCCAWARSGCGAVDRAATTRTSTAATGRTGRRPCLTSCIRSSCRSSGQAASSAAPVGGGRRRHRAGSTSHRPDPWCAGHGGPRGSRCRMPGPDAAVRAGHGAGAPPGDIEDDPGRHRPGAGHRRCGPARTAGARAGLPGSHADPERRRRGRSARRRPPGRGSLDDEDPQSTRPGRTP
jgi:hypothetical protein